MNTNLASATW